ncbi:Uracil phosphoribosyltransferase, partial [Cucurbita argyrosperma subsp. sororia]
MASCRINLPHRCSSGTPRLGPTWSLQNPNPPPPPQLLSPFPSLLNSNKLSYSRIRRRSFIAMNAQMATEPKPVSDDRMLVYVPPHPLIKHWVSVLRNEQTPCPIFKNAMAELGRLLIYEASRDWLPTVTGEIQSPMGVASVEFVDPREPVAIIPILRAGLALAEYASSVLPATKMYHLGISRDEETLQPTIYLNKLPENFPEGSRIFVVDPMLATASSTSTATATARATTSTSTSTSGITSSFPTTVIHSSPAENCSVVAINRTSAVHLKLMYFPPIA